MLQYFLINQILLTYQKGDKNEYLDRESDCS